MLFIAPGPELVLDGPEKGISAITKDILQRRTDTENMEKLDRFYFHDMQRQIPLSPSPSKRRHKLLKVMYPLMPEVIFEWHLIRK